MRTRLITGLRGPVHPPVSAVVTVGVFDGVHVAHQQLVRSSVRLARRLHGVSVVITFDPDPQHVLDPRRAPPALMPLDARLDALRSLGVDWIWVIPFSRRFARVTAEVFIRRILSQRLRTTTLIVGESFAFGKNRQGDMTVLRRLGPLLGIRIVAVRPISRTGAPVSSSRIRHLIAAGRLAQARGLLGRSPALYGTVVQGAGRGRHLGFPTANIALIPQVLPPRGVYAVAVRVHGRCGSWQGVMNLGVRPTFGPGPLVCEVHILTFSGSLRGRRIQLDLLGRLRGERCFDSPEALRRQIRRDLLRARHLFTFTRNSSPLSTSHP